MRTKALFLSLFILLQFIQPTFAYQIPTSTTEIEHTLGSVYNKYKNLNAGKNADYIPELAKVDKNLFAISIATVTGQTYSVGDSDVPFAIESISKPFAFALALADNGQEVIFNHVGLNATGDKFNSLIAIEQKPDHLQNPYVNAGAIQVTNFIKGTNSEEKWQRMVSFFKALGDGKLYFSDKIYQSEITTNQRNRAITELLNAHGMLHGDILDALDRYTKACSMMVTSKQLALIGATLANDGINPLTNKRVISSQNVKAVLAEMVINGLYENSGTWFVTVGLPAKSGVGGAILAIVPGKMAIVVFSPPLDEAGNSVKAQAVIQDLANKWQMHLI